jgi:tRNA dimethylallyltransferase
MVAVITGPTASGKSALAMAVAQAIGGTIINADASQLYADLSIISARPSLADEARVPHRLYGVLDGDDGASAARWADMAKAAITDVLRQGRVPMLVGGTGMYLTTLIDGIAPVPEIDPAVRAGVRGMETADAAAALAREDAALAAKLKPADRQRIFRCAADDGRCAARRIARACRGAAVADGRSRCAGRGGGAAGAASAR